MKQSSWRRTTISAPLLRPLQLFEGVREELSPGIGRSVGIDSNQVSSLAGWRYHGDEIYVIREKEGDADRFERIEEEDVRDDLTMVYVEPVPSRDDSGTVVETPLPAVLAPGSKPLRL